MLDAATATELLRRAETAAARAYAPYSRFAVGAALLTADGSIHDGANIENASFGLTVCAERTALFAAILAGHREVVAVAVATPRAPGSSPCGACRQVLNEFKPATSDLIVLLQGEAGPLQVPLGTLLPLAFGPRDLERSMGAEGEEG